MSNTAPTAEFGLVLASRSPQRLALLRQLGIEPVCIATDIDEAPLPQETPLSLVKRLASRKAAAIKAAQLPRQQSAVADTASAWLILGADTVIELDGRILGKPVGRHDGLQMLAALSDRTHSVHTGISICAADGQQSETFSVSTQVQFGPLTTAMAEAYWDTGEPADKAGGYAIQGRGAQFIAHISGSYSNVVGLPLYESLEVLRRRGLVQST